MASRIVRAIHASDLSIYDPLKPSDRLYLADATLERILNDSLRGLNLNYPIRTRSKVLKTAVCEALGYPVPEAFRKSHPRFPGQNFDTYTQKSDNLQIWNEEISPSRRYVLIRVNENSVVTKVRVVSGETIAAYDTTGTLTQKYQAKNRKPINESRLAVQVDTGHVLEWLRKSPAHIRRGFVPIDRLFEMLVKLTGTAISNPGVDQERNRGAALHRAVCKCLGKRGYSDCGQFPDMPTANAHSG